MSSNDSVSHWIHQLKAGDQDAVQPLWELYFHQLVRLARQKLQGAARRVADEEDVALSAFKSVCLNAENGRFPKLEDRQDLWRLLVVFTARKAFRLINHERRQKRGGEASITAADHELENIVGDEPTPAFAAEVAEECDRLLKLLGEGDLQKVALKKLEGYTTDEIASQMNCVPRTIERKLRLIRTLWDHDDAE